MPVAMPSEIETPIGIITFDGEEMPRTDLAQPGTNDNAQSIAAPTIADALSRIPDAMPVITSATQPRNDVAHSPSFVTSAAAAVVIQPAMTRYRSPRRARMNGIASFATQSMNALPQAISAVLIAGNAVSVIQGAR